MAEPRLTSDTEEALREQLRHLSHDDAAGVVDGAPVTLAIFDHPSSYGYPTYWHARGYGLFAANPLGQKAMSNGKDELNFKLDAGKSTTFRHQVLIVSGTVSPTDMEKFYEGFSH